MADRTVSEHRMPRTPRGWSIAQRVAYYTAQPNERGCRLWLGAKDNFGYGQLMCLRDGMKRPIKAHRLAWEIAKGLVPSGLYVCHRCDTPACVRVEHLFLGTHADNQADKVAKGRQERGIAHGMAKLTDDQVRAIRADMRLQRIIAAEYGIAQARVSEIKSRKSWSHVT